MKISKADFQEFVDFTINLEDRLINPFIDKAFLRDVKPKIKDAQADLVEGYELTDEPPTDGTPDPALLYAAVKPYWVLAAYHRHILLHGINHTPAGLTVATGEKFAPISDTQRARMLSAVASDMNFYEGEMMKYVKGAYPDQFEDTTCSTRKTKNRMGLRVVKDRYSCRCGRHECRGGCL